MSDPNLRHIYDFLESKKYSLALLECESLLLKDKDSLIVKALKSFTLLKLNKRDEALEFADQVLDSKASTLNSNIINSLSLTYRNLGLNSRLERLYSKAAELYPTVEKYVIEWFMSCVREFNLKSQSRAAVLLNKNFQKRHYLWWSVTSFYLLYKYSADQQEKALSLTLAQRLCDKAMQSSWVQTRAEISMYVLVFSAGSVSNKVIQLLESTSGQPKVVKENPDLRISHLKSLKAANDADKLFSRSLEYMKISNNWAEYVLGVSVLSLPGIKQADMEDKARQLEKTFNEWSNDPLRKRNAILAKLELLVQAKSKNSDVIVSQLWEYFDNFSSKPLCFSDMVGYLQLFLAKGKVFNVWARSLEHKAKQIQMTKINNDSNASIFANLEKIVWLTTDIAIFNGHTFKTDDDIQKSTYIIETAYSIDQSLVSKDSISDIIVLAFFYLVKLAESMKNDGNEKGAHALYYLLLALIEAEIEKNTAYYQFKFLALRVYLNLGVYERALDLYTLLSIKNIQNDSLGFWILGQGMALGNYKEDIDEYYNTIQTYEANKADTPIMVSLAYEHFSYDKVVEFVELNDQISYSLEGANTLLQAMQEEILIHENPDEIVSMLSESNLPCTTSLDPAFLSRLYDNRDLSVIQCPSLNRVQAMRLQDRTESQKSFIDPKNSKSLSIEQMLRYQKLTNVPLLEMRSRISLALYYISTKNMNMILQNLNEIRKLVSREAKVNVLEKDFGLKPCLTGLKYNCEVNNSQQLTSVEQLDLISAKITYDLSNFVAFNLGKAFPKFKELEPLPKNVSIPSESQANALISTFTSFTNFVFDQKKFATGILLDYIPLFLRYSSTWTQCYSYIWLAYKLLKSTNNSVASDSVLPLDEPIQTLLHLLESTSELSLQIIGMFSSYLTNASINDIETYWSNNASIELVSFIEISKQRAVSPMLVKVQQNCKSSWLNSISQISGEIKRRKLQ